MPMALSPAASVGLHAATCAASSDDAPRVFRDESALWDGWCRDEIALAQPVIVRSMGVDPVVAGRALVATIVPPAARALVLRGALSDGRTRAALHRVRVAYGPAVALRCARGLDRLGRALAARMGWPAAVALREQAPDEAPRARRLTHALLDATRLHDEQRITDDERAERARAATEHAIDEAISARAGAPKTPWLDPWIRDDLEPVGARDERSLHGDRWIARSFAQGLSPHEWAQHATNARESQRASQLRLQDERAYARALDRLLRAITVRVEDCGTTASQRVDRQRAEGLVLAEDTPPMKRSEILSRRALDALAVASVTHVRVRTPLGCEASDGVCAHCYGADVRTQRLPAVGDKVGLRSARVLRGHAAALVQRTAERIIC